MAGKGNVSPIIYILLAFCIGIVVICIVAAILFYVYNDDTNGNIVPCTTDNQCYPGMSCSTDKGYCESIVCKTDSDCSGSQGCVNGTCTTQACKETSDCSENEMCYHARCIPSGSTCASSSDCNGGAIPCIGGVCQVCATNSDCKNGGYCSNGSCVNNCSGNCSSGEVCVSNKIQQCCQDDGNCGKSCSSTGTSSSCKYCVNNIYSCKQGEVFETCTSDTDCASGKCLMDSALGNVCAYINNQSCISNYDSNSNFPYACTSEHPYCSKGGCIDTPLYSKCDVNNPCRTANLNTSDPPTYTTDVTGTYSYYCVSGFCRENPGSYGESCITTADCAYTTDSTTGTLSQLQCVSNVCS